MTKIIEVEGIGEVYAKKLEAAGVSTTEQLLEKGSTPKGRQSLVEATKINEHLVLKWVNEVDLFRIKGVGSEYAELLEAAGVDTVVELSKRVPDHLLEKMTEVNTTGKLVRKLPTVNQVTAWVAEAKTLPRVVTY
jgi:predicted flap endonuclease-1-like 5' DNA nuclease